MSASDEKLVKLLKKALAATRSAYAYLIALKTMQMAFEDAGLEMSDDLLMAIDETQVKQQLQVWGQHCDAIYRCVELFGGENEAHVQEISWSASTKKAEAKSEPPPSSSIAASVGMRPKGGKLDKAAASLKSGGTIRDATRASGLSKQTVMKLADRVGFDDEKCGCGRPRTHRGRCHARRERTGTDEKKFGVHAQPDPKPAQGKVFKAAPAADGLSKWGDIVDRCVSLKIGSKTRFTPFDGMPLPQFANQFRAILSHGTNKTKLMRFRVDAYTFRRENMVQVTRDDDWESPFTAPKSALESSLDPRDRLGCIEKGCVYPLAPGAILCSHHLKERELQSSPTGSTLSASFTK